MNLFYFFQLFLTAFIFSFFAFPIFIRILERYQILDSPGTRKVHKTHTPSMGGVPIFIGILATLIIWWPIETLGEYKMFLSSLGLIFLIGLQDDLLPLKATQKLVSQLIPITLVVVAGFALAPSLYGLVGQLEISIFLSIPLSIFTMVVIINSINLIDGADGLASSLGILIISFFAIWFYMNGEIGLSILSVTFIGAFLAFLFFNWMPSRIFMGDTGALMLGLIIAFFTVNFLNVNHSLEFGNMYGFNATIGTALCLLFVPLFDTLRVFIIRLRAGVSPFTADKNHIHHVLLRLGLNHAQTTLCLLLINSSFIGFAILMRSFPDKVMIPLVLLISIAFGLAINRLLVSRLSKKQVRRLS